MNHYKNEIVSVNGTEHKNLDSSFVKECSVGDHVQLIREPNNVYDRKAVAVICHGRHIGYIPRKEAGTRLAHILDSNRHYQAELSKVAPQNKRRIFELKISTFPQSAEQPRPRIQPQSRSTPKKPPFRKQDHGKAIKNAREKCGIYQIICKNGKNYVGQSIHIGSRWQRHISELSAGFHCNAQLNNNWAKFGSRQFRFEVIEECKPDLLDEREKFHIERFNSYHSGYNATVDGQGLDYYDKDGDESYLNSETSTAKKNCSISYKAIRDGLYPLPGEQVFCPDAMEKTSEKSPVENPSAQVDLKQRTIATSLDKNIEYAHKITKRYPDAENIVNSAEFNLWLQNADPLIKDKSRSLIPEDGLVVIRIYKLYLESRSRHKEKNKIEKLNYYDKGRQESYSNPETSMANEKDASSHKAIQDALSPRPGEQIFRPDATTQASKKPSIAKLPAQVDVTQKPMAILFNQHVKYAHELKKRFPEVERIVNSAEFNLWLQASNQWNKDKSRSVNPTDGLLVLTMYHIHLESNSSNRNKSITKKLPVYDRSPKRHSGWRKVKNAVKNLFSITKS
jgi:group I intron endonuclease